ncbi:MAG TPA: hypothetical protein VFH58_04780 [Acidimicrobiales bacterium]|nr:hypothetical protein [Acidimicrobiales bacterium]
MRQPPRNHSQQPVPGAVAIPDSAVRAVHSALGHVRARLSEPTVSPPDLLEPLLQLWAAANEVHPWVALPVQHFLTGLVPERAVPSADVAALAEDVHLLLLEVCALAAHDPAGAEALVPSSAPAGIGTGAAPAGTGAAPAATGAATAP